MYSTPSIRAGAQLLGGEQLVERGFQVARQVPGGEISTVDSKQFIPRQAGVAVARVVPQRVEQPRRHPQAASLSQIASAAAMVST